MSYLMVVLGVIGLLLVFLAGWGVGISRSMSREDYDWDLDDDEEDGYSD